MSNDEDRNLSIMGRYLINLCNSIIRDVREGKCSEEEMSKIITKSEPRHNGYIDPYDYMNADKASKYVGVSRGDFFFYAKKHKVSPTKINNQPIGYYIKDLDRIKQDVIEMRMKE